MMERKIVSGPDVPVSGLPFSPGLKVGPWLFISGQASVDKKGNIVVDSFEGEMRRSFENLKDILKGADLDLSHAVQVRCYVGKKEYLAEFNTIYREYFDAPYPARTTLIGCLSDLLKFEVDLVAYADPT